ncbi:MAG: glucose 1-dehydrogenase [Dehalococcoidia bacterium]
MANQDLFDLSGKVAIVTGGNGGLGKGMALGLAGAGANIAIAARNAQKNAQAAAEIVALGVEVLEIRSDVTVEADVKDLVRQTIDAFGHVDILINNAGTSIRKRPEEYSMEEWDSILNVNLRSAFLASREVYPHMKQAGGGKIINIGSMTSIFGSDWAASYSASKGGIVQLARSLAVAWAEDNIQVNSILPGWLVTDLTAGIPQRDPDRYRHITERIPAGRWGDPLDMRGAAVFLASAASDYVTGAVIAVDGGFSAK